MFICLKVIRSNSYRENFYFLFFLMFVFVYVQKDKLSYKSNSKLINFITFPLLFEYCVCLVSAYSIG